MIADHLFEGARILIRALYILLLILLASCTVKHQGPLSIEHDFHREIILKYAVPIVTYHNITTPRPKMLRFYIEGDGNSFVTKNKISGNPTPHNPVGFTMAIADNHPDVIYLARPCQYILDDYKVECPKNLWTCDRFSPEMIEVYNNIISDYKQRFNAKKVEIVGYSGGGVIATMVATKRDDIDLIATIGSPLDLNKWTNHHKVSTLSNAMSPIDHSKTLCKIPQVHIFGKKDNVVPKTVQTDFINSMKECPAVQFIDIDSTHSCCFENLFEDTIKY